MTNQIIMTIGLNDKDQLVQVIDTEKAENIIIDIILASGIEAFTLIPVTGLYKMSSGKTVRERSYRVEIADFSNTITRDMVKYVIDNVKEKLNQESVMYQEKGNNIYFL